MYNELVSSLCRALGACPLFFSAAVLNGVGDGTSPSGLGILCEACKPEVVFSGGCAFGWPITIHSQSNANCEEDLGICFHTTGDCMMKITVQVSAPAGTNSMRANGGCVNIGPGWNGVNVEMGPSAGDGNCGRRTSLNVDMCSNACHLPCLQAISQFLWHALVFGVQQHVTPQVAPRYVFWHGCQVAADIHFGPREGCPLLVERAE